MNLANKLTLLRIIAAPVFLIIYFLPNASAFWTVPVLLFIYISSEITDYLDGYVARKLNLTSDFGKFFDPFADTLVQITYFFCFVVDGIWGSGLFPAILLLLVIYRELSILFIRNLMLRKGITLGARMGGKVKTVAYIVTGSTAMLVVLIERLLLPLIPILEIVLPFIRISALVIFILSVIIAIISFIDYFIIYKKQGIGDD